MDAEYYHCAECSHGKLHGCDECEKEANAAYEENVRKMRNDAYDEMSDWKKKVKLTRYRKL